MKLSILIQSSLLILGVTTSPSKFRNYLECRCGERKVELQQEEKSLVRVREGSEASRNEFPWAARLEIRIGQTNFQCGGTLVSDRHILTAAHCVKPGNQTLYVTVILGRSHKYSARF